MMATLAAWAAATAEDWLGAVVVGDGHAAPTAAWMPARV